MEPLPNLVSLEALAEKLELVTRIARTLVEKSAQRFEIPCPSVRVQAQEDAMVIVAGSEPRLDISASWLFSLVLSDTKLLTAALERAVIVSADRAKATLNQPNPYSYVWVQESRKFRKSQKDYVLPEKYFSESLTVTLTCPLTGRSLSAICPKHSQKVVEAKLRKQLTELLFDDDATAELLDTIEAARRAHDSTPVPSSIVHIELPDGFVQTLRYDEPLPASFTVASHYVMYSPL